MRARPLQWRAAAGLHKPYDLFQVAEIADILMAQAEVELILQQKGDLQVLQRIPRGLGGARGVLGVSDVPPQHHAQQAADLSSGAGWFHKVEAAIRRCPAV